MNTHPPACLTVAPYHPAEPVRVAGTSPTMPPLHGVLSEPRVILLKSSDSTACDTWAAWLLATGRLSVSWMFNTCAVDGPENNLPSPGSLAGRPASAARTELAHASQINRFLIEDCWLIININLDLNPDSKIRSIMAPGACIAGWHVLLGLCKCNINNLYMAHFATLFCFDVAKCANNQPFWR